MHAGPCLNGSGGLFYDHILSAVAGHSRAPQPPLQSCIFNVNSVAGSTNHSSGVKTTGHVPEHTKKERRKERKNDRERKKEKWKHPHPLHEYPYLGENTASVYLAPNMGSLMAALHGLNTLLPSPSVAAPYPLCFSNPASISRFSHQPSSKQVTHHGNQPSTPSHFVITVDRKAPPTLPRSQNCPTAGGSSLMGDPHSYGPYRCGILTAGGPSCWGGHHCWGILTGPHGYVL